MKEENNKNTVSPLADIPQGLGMVLTRDIDAMRVFSQMSDAERKSVIDGARSIHSKAQMRDYVKSIKG